VTKGSARIPVVEDEACCASVLAAPLDESDAAELARGFAALADPARLQILSILAASPAGEVCVCDFVEPLGKSQPTVSHHLKVLGDAGLEGLQSVVFQLVVQFVQQLDANDFTVAPFGAQKVGPIQAMGFQPGPLFAEILRSLEDAQLEGEIRTSQEAEKYGTYSSGAPLRSIVAPRRNWKGWPRAR